MPDRAALVKAVQEAWDGRGLAQAVAALDRHDQNRRHEIEQDRELDMAARQVTARLTPVPVHEFHTAATDWLMDYEAPADYRTAMIAEASSWYGRLDPAVRADGEELAEQAFLRSASLASQYGGAAQAAQKEFLSYVSYLAREGASGLPQIQQLIDPNNQPSATPLPAQVFDNFAPEQNDYNGGVESPSHSSGISSQQAPFLQQLQQQDGSGSGFGGGPARPLEHTTRMDTSNSYAEVPLGTPGQIPTTPAPVSQAGGGSTPNPTAGSDQVADDDPLNRQMGQPGSDADEDDNRRQASWSRPDAAGFQWITGHLRSAEPPFHVACKGDHWPDQGCGSQHTASVAIGYSQSYEDVAREVGLERLGMQEGLKAISGAKSLAALLAHHNRLVTAYAQGEREADDAAVLHGFLAVVRPVLARDFSEKQREDATKEGDAVDGKLPIKDKQDFENAEKLKGKVKGVPKSQVDSYMDKKEQEYDGDDDDDDDDDDDKDDKD